MTMHRLLVLLLCAAAVRVAFAQSGDLAILEQSGRASGMQLKTPVADYDATLRLQRAGVYQSVDGSVEVSTDSSGKVSRIAVSKSGMFTQRLVTIGQSSLQDVAERYGKPTRVYEKSGRIVLAYEHLSFAAAPGVNVDKSDPLKGWTVQEIALFEDQGDTFLYVYAKSGALSFSKPSIFVDNVPVARLQSGRFFKVRLPSAAAANVCAESVLKAQHPCVSVAVNGGIGYVRVERSILRGYDLRPVSQQNMQADLGQLRPIDTDLIRAKDLIVEP